jgi:3-methyladenine DNA glycosylase AlkC
MAELLKDRFFTEESLTLFADATKPHFSGFETSTFIKLVQDSNWKNLELKEKMRHTTLCLQKVLPEDYGEALEILKKAAPKVKGFEVMCLPDYVEVFGLDNWNISLPALKHFTRYGSSEFAIRPFLNSDLSRAMELMYLCVDDKEENVRRFASEGCRPRLPWAMAVPGLKKNPEPIIPVLEKLKADPSEFVRRSVANNLNDISKDHPDIVLDIAEKWLGKSEETDKLVKHALRTLFKAGNTRAMRLFGYGDPVNIEVRNFNLGTKKMSIGESGRFSFDLMVDEKKATKIRIEYAIFYMKKNGKHSKKVFKLSEKEQSPGKHFISRKYGFVDMSTRKHYPGEHFISIIVNGVEKAKTSIIVV